MGIIQSGRRTESEGEIEIDRGASTSLRWTEVTVAVFDDSGDAADPSTVTGTLTGSVLKAGAGKREDFNESIDLSSDPWSWKPELSTVQIFYFSVSGLNADHTYEISINSWSY